MNIAPESTNSLLEQLDIYDIIPEKTKDQLEN